MAYETGKTIEVWDSHSPISLDDVRVALAQEKRQPLPADVEARVDANWARFTQKNPSAKDQDAAYLISYVHNGGRINAEVFTAGFRYNQYLNRDDNAMQDSAVANSLNYNPFASWIIAVCDNGKYVLFGNKRDFGNKKVSGFGGFTNKSDLVGEQPVVLDVNHFIQRKLEEELKGMSSRIAGKYMIGLDYNPLVGPKGFDGVYLVELDGKADDLEKLFGESTQFGKQLIRVPADPKSLLAFLEGSEWEPTNSCVGGVLNYVGSRFGKEEMAALHAQYSRKDKVVLFDSPPNGDVRERILALPR